MGNSDLGILCNKKIVAVSVLNIVIVDLVHTIYCKVVDENDFVVVGKISKEIKDEKIDNPILQKLNHNVHILVWEKNWANTAKHVLNEKKMEVWIFHNNVVDNNFEIKEIDENVDDLFVDKDKEVVLDYVVFDTDSWVHAESFIVSKEVASEKVDNLGTVVVHKNVKKVVHFKNKNARLKVLEHSVTIDGFLDRIVLGEISILNSIKAAVAVADIESKNVAFAETKGDNILASIGIGNFINKIR